MPPNPAPRSHRVVAADVHAVPAPFLTFAVRSDEPQHASDVRTPCGWVHIVRAASLDAGSLANLAREDGLRLHPESFLDIGFAATTLAALDLMVAEFDDRSGTIPRVRTLVDGMKRGTCQVDEAMG